ncbi:hypothetical protein MA16_Dca013664 [Dendrobium catenatum]|uniref:Reverse transcriptase zinc-binding domain-containing protein n=1 Tax=Dendrobium catenatum TaxID=906689 RepID=A0A2I0WPF5_9ASPA|nr:hypothetical protein MA16_Dca013664 [Dendrobium catenatum]
MPAMMGKAKTQQQLINNLQIEFEKDYISTICIYDSAVPCLSWENNSFGSFREYVKSFYIQESTFAWYNLIWHTKSVLQFSICSWMAVMERLKTADELLKHNITVPSICGLCHCAPESVSHLFFECSYSFSIITHI